MDFSTNNSWYGGAKMVDQIQEPTLNHAEALRHRVERVSWNWVIPAGIALGIAMIIATAAIFFLVFAGTQSSSATSATQEQDNTAFAPSRAPVAQLETAAPVVVAKEWPKTQVQWTEVPVTPGVYLMNPYTLNDGFYTGTVNVPERGSVTTEEGTAYALRILPQSESEGGIFVAAARDAVNKGVVFAALDTTGDEMGRLFLSVDGEKTWTEVNMPALLWVPATGVGGLRVKAEGDFIHLTARDNTVQEKWWGATIRRNELP